MLTWVCSQNTVSGETGLLWRLQEGKPLYAVITWESPPWNGHSPHRQRHMVAGCLSLWEQWLLSCMKSEWTRCRFFLWKCFIAAAYATWMCHTDVTFQSKELHESQGTCFRTFVQVQEASLMEACLGHGTQAHPGYFPSWSWPSFHDELSVALSGLVETARAAPSKQCCCCFFANWASSGLTVLSPCLLCSRATRLHMCAHTLFRILFHRGASQDADRSPLCHHSVCNGLHLPAPNIPPSLFPPWQPVGSLCLWVYFYFMDKFTCVLF